MGNLSHKVVTTSSGAEIPAIGLGTFEPGSLGSDRCATAVKEGLRAGYRHIDTAALYGCEEEVGQGIRASGIPRSELFICTKFWQQYHDPVDVEKSLDESLERMQLDYVDLYLMHWPLAFKRTENYDILTGEDGKPVIDHELSSNHELTWRAMEGLVRSGKARYIGVSNFTIAQLDKLLKVADTIPTCNQVEVHPWFPQDEMLAYCKSKGIALVAYSPLGSQPGAMHQVTARLLDDEDVVATAEKNGVTPAQLLVSWVVQRGMVVLPKSATPSRIQSNFDVSELPDEDFRYISEICARNPSKRHRFVNFDPLWGTSQFAGDP